MDIVIALFTQVVLSLVPVALLYYLLNVIEKQPHTSLKKGLGWTIDGITLFAFLGILIIGFMLHVVAFSITYLPMEPSFHHLIKPFHRYGLSLWPAALLALILLIPRVKRWLAQFIPIQPDNRIHTTSLILSTIILIQLGMTLAVGIETLSATVSPSNAWELIVGLWAQDLMFFIIACLGVGYLTRRTGKETLQRLGLTPITFKQLFFGILLAIGLVFIASLLEILLSKTSFGIDPDVQKYTEKLIGPLFTSIPGILTLGFAAAIGEEALFRGALQPRFGLLLTSALFTLVHSNYGLSFSTLIVFGIGICLGIIRNRFNTTTAMITHACYNMTLAMMTYLHF